jgi:phospholipid/cholesterol/gamma-HCH transport system substrate-binding protein
VGAFNDNMAAVADLLEAERQDLAEAFSLLDQALADVAGFIQDNTDLLAANVNKLADVTLALVQQRQAMAEVLDVAPLALGNLAHAYNPDYGTLDTRDNGLGANNAEVVVCGVLAQLGRLQLPAGIDINDPLQLLELPQTERICARLLSGDANNDRQPDDLDGNGVPDLEQLWAAIWGGSAPGSPGGAPIGFPPLPAGGQ